MPDLDDVLESQAESKASFCLATGIAPSEYDNLTGYEIEAFIKEAKRRNRKKR